MLMTNEVRSAYRTVTDTEEMYELLDAGWTVIPEAEEQPEPPKKEEKAVAVPVNPVNIVTEKRESNAKGPQKIKGLKYKKMYITQWISLGKVSDLREILNHVGIDFPKNAKRCELEKLLREYVRKVKNYKETEDTQGDGV